MFKNLRESGSSVEDIHENVEGACQGKHKMFKPSYMCWVAL